MKYLSILYLEDHDVDVELVRSNLEAKGIEFDLQHVETRAEFVVAQKKGPVLSDDEGQFDIILTDYALPSFDGVSALKLAAEMCPGTPVIMVSGQIGEETAIEIIKKGATDYVLKQRMERLVPTVKRALKEAEELRARTRAEKALRESEEKFRTIFDSVNDAVFIHDVKTGAILDANSKMCEMYGYSREEVDQLEMQALSSGEVPYARQDALEWIKKAVVGKPQVFEWMAKHKSGHLFWVEVSMKTSVMALIGLATLFLGLILMFVLPGSRIISYGLLAIGGALAAIATSLDIKRLKRAIQSGRGRFSVGTSLSIVLFLGIVLLANAISVSQNKRIDFTGLEQFTLTSQTKKVLADLRTQVEIVSFFSPSVPPQVRNYAHDLLMEYQVYSDFLTIRETDPDIQPDEARRFGLDRSAALLGAVIFRGASGQRQILSPQISAEAEHAFTSALLEVSGGKQKHIYFLKGHGEHDLDRGYKNVADGLKDNLFSVSDINLSVTPAIPEDASAIVIAGPGEPLASAELDILKSFLKDDGRMLVLLDPDPPQSYRELLSDWWIEIDDGYMIEPSAYVVPYRSNPLVTRDRNSLQLNEIFFIGATAVIPTQNHPNTIEVSALAWTTRDAWLEKREEDAAEAVFDPDLDRMGPRAFGILIFEQAEPGEEQFQGTRIVAIGDSDFATDNNFHNGGNSALFLSMVSWLTEGEDIINIDRKVLVTRRLILNPEQARFLHLSSIGLLPLALLIGAVVVWWRRRRS